MKGSESDLYFILNPALGIIKIGIAGNVEYRRRSLEHACGVALEVLRVVDGGERYERELHVAFDDTRLRGEWFAPSEELLALVDSAESIPAFLARKKGAIAARLEARRSVDERARAARAEETRAEREELARLAAERKRIKREREEKERRRREAQQAAKRKQDEERRAEWASRASEALRRRVIDNTRAQEAAERQAQVAAQRTRNAALLGVAPAGGVA